MARSIGLDVLSIFFKNTQIDKHINTHTHIVLVPAFRFFSHFTVT